MEFLKEKRNIETRVDEIADLLQSIFPDHWNDKEAKREVLESIDDDKERISIVATEGGLVVGWIAGFQTYSHAYELHPLIVRESKRHQGIGRELVSRFEAIAKSRGMLTVYLGSDDEDFSTSLSGCDLFPDVLPKARKIENRHGHPYTFYQKCGYEIVGVMPDANGIGKPDIVLAKSLRQP